GSDCSGPDSRALLDPFEPTLGAWFKSLPVQILRLDHACSRTYVLLSLACMEQIGHWIQQERERLSDEAYFAGGGALIPDAAAYADFNELVAPLEERTGQPLKGPNRNKCLRVFISSPDAF